MNSISSRGLGMGIINLISPIPFHLSLSQNWFLRTINQFVKLRFIVSERTMTRRTNWRCVTETRHHHSLKQWSIQRPWKHIYNDQLLEIYYVLQPKIRQVKTAEVHSSLNNIRTPDYALSQWARILFATYITSSSIGWDQSSLAWDNGYDIGPINRIRVMNSDALISQKQTQSFRVDNQLSASTLITLIIITTSHPIHHHGPSDAPTWSMVWAGSTEKSTPALNDVVMAWRYFPHNKRPGVRSFDIFLAWIGTSFW